MTADGLSFRLTCLVPCTDLPPECHHARRSAWVLSGVVRGKPWKWSADAVCVTAPLRAIVAGGALCSIGMLVSGCELGDQSFLYLGPEHGGHSADSGRPRNRPPLLSLVYAAPQQTDVGARITISAAAADPDGDAVSFLWTASGGVIGNPHTASTYYVCREPGDHAVVIMVSDPGGLEERMGFSVSCV
jgi:hypothetical protein